NSASFAYSEPFTRAGPRKKRRRKPSGEPPQPLEQLERTKKELESNTVWLSTCHGSFLRRKHDPLCFPEILQDVLQDLSFAASEVLCLGLGSPVSSRDARAQLAFLIRFCSLCDIDLQNVSVYDPVFTDADSALLQALGMQCLADNRARTFSIRVSIFYLFQNAKHPVIRPTILYMPHCDMDLYENIIRENWTREQLSNIIFIANRFSDYIDK
ncbi:hypothetical protein SERLADRAFT_335274, partial [Serpula lacrymans var. lacrymans S7.9]